MYTIVCLCVSAMSESSSHSSSVASGASDTDGLERLCSRLNRKVSIPLTTDLAVAEHESIVRSMLKIRDVLLRGTHASDACKASVMCAGVSVFKRLSTRSDEDETTNLKTTVSLMFALLVLMEESEVAATGDEDYEMDVDDADEEDSTLVRAWGNATLEQYMFPNGEPSSSWESVLKSDAAVSRASLKAAMLVKDKGAMATMWMLASTFFITSCGAMQASLLSGYVGEEEESDNFLTLDAAAFMSEANVDEEEKLLSIVDAAESEAGQAVFRDLILSFRLPKAVVGVRRTLLLSRDANRIATQQYTEILNDAHNCAMRGPIYEYKSEKSDDTTRGCALLAGMAVLLYKNQDGIRKDDAFSGRVVLPFLETIPFNGPMLTAVPGSSDWAVFEIKNDAPRIHLKKQGIEGLKKGLLLLNTRIRK